MFKSMIITAISFNRVMYNQKLYIKPCFLVFILIFFIFYDLLWEYRILPTYIYECTLFNVFVFHSCYLIVKKALSPTAYDLIHGIIDTWWLSLRSAIGAWDPFDL